MKLGVADVQYSSQLPSTRAWTYGQTVPGPTIEVKQEQTIHIRWWNTIEESLPFRVVVFPDGDPSNQNASGPEGGVLDDAANALKASIVVHLHGGLSAPDSDGWTENVYPPGRSMNATYGQADRPGCESQRAALLWYHDHAVGVTRLNVYAGLFGFWVVHDQAERDAVDAGLLPDEDHELRLLIQDRNFDADADGNLCGAILHKTETSTAEMFGPCTIVNGKLWPKAEVPARPMRIRILNGSNSRTYCLRLVELGPDDAAGFPTYIDNDLSNPATPPELNHWWQVGTDGGLLDYPVLPVSFGPLASDHFLPVTAKERIDLNRGLILAPAERVDLVIDFGRLAGKLKDQGPTGPAGRAAQHGLRPVPRLDDHLSLQVQGRRHDHLRDRGWNTGRRRTDPGPGAERHPKIVPRRDRRRRSDERHLDRRPPGQGPPSLPPTSSGSTSGPTRPSPSLRPWLSISSARSARPSCPNPGACRRSTRTSNASSTSRGRAGAATNSRCPPTISTAGSPSASIPRAT